MDEYKNYAKYKGVILQRAYLRILIEDLVKNNPIIQYNSGLQNDIKEAMIKFVKNQQKMNKAVRNSRMKKLKESKII